MSNGVSILDHVLANSRVETRLAGPERCISEGKPASCFEAVYVGQGEQSDEKGGSTDFGYGA